MNTRALPLYATIAIFLIAYLLCWLQFPNILSTRVIGNLLTMYGRQNNLWVCAMISSSFALGGLMSVRLSAFRVQYRTLLPPLGVHANAGQHSD